MLVQDALVAGARFRLQMDGLGLPFPRPRSEGDATARRVGVRACREIYTDGVEPSLRVDLAGEVAGVLPAGGVAVPGSVLAVRVFADAGHD